LSYSTAAGDLCRFRDQPCLDWVRQHAGQIAAAAEENRELLDRYLAMRTLPGFGNTLLPNLQTPLPSYQILLHLNRLHAALAVSRVIAGEPQAGL